MKQWYEQLRKRKYFAHAMAFLIPFLICIGICIGNGIFPLGNSCMLHVDMYHQYCPFFTEFLDKLQNGGSLLYTWNLGLGSDFVSLYAYYLASPLNWLIILCPKAYVIEFMTLLILLKIAFCGLTFFIFLKGHYSLSGKDGKLHSNTVVPALVCSTAYALSGFVAAYNWDIMWMDCIALTPLIILGLEKLVKENKVALYYCTLAISILANYYISIMICMFLVFYFVVLFVEQKQGRWRSFLRFSVYSLLAGGTGAVLLIPEYLILGYSGSQRIDFPKTVEWYFNLIEELFRTCVATYSYTGREHWPNIYTGAFTTLLFVLYVLNTRITWKKKLPRVFMLGFFLLSFANNYLDFIWHGFHFPDSLPGRQSFLYSFLLLSISFDTLRKWKGTKLWHIATALVCGAVLILWGFIQSDTELIDPLSFAVTGIFLACYGILMILHKLSNRSMQRFLRSFAFVLVLCELTASMAVTSFSTTSRTAYTAKMDDYDALLELAEADNQEGFYRVEDPERMTKNDDMLYGYPSGTQFSSLMNINVSHFYQSVLMEGGKNFYCYNGANPIVSAMLSVKYQLMDNDMEAGELRTLVGRSGKYYLYRSNYCLPLGFMLSEDTIDAWDHSSSYKVNNINNLALSLGADTQMLQLANCNVSEEKGAATIEVHEAGYYYAVYGGCSSDTLTAKTSDGRSRTFSKASHKYLLELGKVDAGESVTISNSNSESIGFQIYRLDISAVEKAYDTLNQQTMELKEQTDTYILGEIDVQEEGRLIFSIPNEAGWSLYVDGKRTDIEDYEETFVSVHLDQGTHKVELKYMTPGLIYGGIISGASVVVVLALMLLRRRKQKREKEEWQNSL